MPDQTAYQKACQEHSRVNRKRELERIQQLLDNTKEAQLKFFTSVTPNTTHVRLHEERLCYVEEVLCAMYKLLL